MGEPKFQGYHQKPTLAQSLARLFPEIMIPGSETALNLIRAGEV